MYDELKTGNSRLNWLIDESLAIIVPTCVVFYVVSTKKSNPLLMWYLVKGRNSSLIPVRLSPLGLCPSLPDRRSVPPLATEFL